MKKYNLSEIMHKAWKLYRKGAAAFAECLHRAWNSAKARPASHRTGFFFALRASRRASGARHIVRHAAGCF